MTSRIRQTLGIAGLLVAIMALAASASAAEPPTVTLEPTIPTTATSAHLTGTVDTHGEVAYVYAEFSTSPTGGFTYRLVREIEAGTVGATPISATVTGLEPETTYYFRLDAENEGEHYSPEPFPSATTAAVVPPTVTIDPSVTTGYTTAQGSGEVDPGNQDMSVEVLFRIAGEETWAHQSIETLAAEAGPTSVSAELSGLRAGTEYEFRLAAFASTREYHSPAPDPTASTQSVAAPTVSIEPVAAPGPRAAQLLGHINPNAPESEPATPGVEAGFAVHWHFECTPECSVTGGVVPADDGTHEVTAEATELLPGTTYHVFLVGENAGGEQTRQVAGPQTFTTPAVKPVITSPVITKVGPSEATVTAEVNPGGAATSYRVEYGLTSSYGSSTPEVGPIGSDNSPHGIAETAKGLEAETTYHWRIVATNSAGTTTTPDQEWRTSAPQPPGFELPDGRSYEQATGPDKGGLNIGGASELQTAASPDGDAITFPTLGTLPGSESGQDFGQYLASRGESEWTTVGLLPPAALGRLGRAIGITEDLNVSYGSTIQRTPDSSTGLFFERDTRTGVVTPISSNPGVPHIVSATPDGSAVTFESGQSLMPGTSPGHPHVYLWDRTSHTVSLASVMNNGEELSEGALGLEGRVRSETLTASGESVIFTGVSDEQIYLRLHAGAQQSQLNGQAECTEPAKACTVEVSKSQATVPDPNGPKAPTLVSVSNGPSPIIFFLSAARLTDDAKTGPEDEGRDLYRFDSGDGILTDITVDDADPAGAEALGVAGMSADGQRGYFVANAVLGDGVTQGATNGDCTLNEFTQSPGGECNLYYWTSAGQIRFVARLNGEGDGPSLPADVWDWWVRRPSGTSWDEYFSSRVSRDGLSLIFRSGRRLPGAPTGGVANFYRFDAEGGSVACVTCDPSAAQQPAPPTLFARLAPVGSSFEAPIQGRNLDEAGDRFFFESGASLAPGDTNGVVACPMVTPSGSAAVPRCQDVYEWEGHGVGTCARAERAGGCVSLISTGASPSPSFFAAADASGDNVFIYTDDRLVAQDRDQLTDIYDAKVGGGLPAQNQAPPTPCVAASSCHGSAGGTVEPETPRSATFTGPERVKEKKHIKCKKGFTRKRRGGHERCVRKKPPDNKKRISKHRHHRKRATAHQKGAK